MNTADMAEMAILDVLEHLAQSAEDDNRHAMAEVLYEAHDKCLRLCADRLMKKTAGASFK